MRSLRRPRPDPTADDPGVDARPRDAAGAVPSPVAVDGAADAAAEAPDADEVLAGEVAESPPPFDSLPLPVITRRRVTLAVGALFSAWIVLMFVRQVGEASAATSRAEAAGEANAALATRVASLQRELDLIQQRPYILLAARGHGLGGEKEIPFTLAADAPPVAADAPGSEGLRLGEATIRRSPLEAWLALLFGPDPAG